MDQSDSAYAYIFRSMDYIDLADSILRADIYHNIAAMYQEQGDDENARKYLEKWKNDKTAISFKGYLIEARLLEAQGHYKEALERVKKNLSEKDPLVRSHAMDVVSRLYEKTGDMGAALDIKRQKDTYTDSVMKANHSLEIADWQRKYDEARWKERSYQRMVKLGGAFLLFLTVMMMGYWWYWRRVRSLRFRLDEHARRITENQAEIERLQQSGEASEQTIANLKKQIENNRQIISNKLLIGTRCFVKLQQKESVADITADEKQCLITYYAQLRPKRWQEWEHTYVSLTTTQYIFLILQEDLHYDDDTIAQILGVKPASLRTLRSRIKGRGK
jgi:DNA repair exonuclease SbcCD ATPase subunit